MGGSGTPAQDRGNDLRGSRLSDPLTASLERSVGWRSTHHGALLHTESPGGHDHLDELQAPATSRGTARLRGATRPRGLSIRAPRVAPRELASGPLEASQLARPEVPSRPEARLALVSDHRCLDLDHHQKPARTAGDEVHLGCVGREASREDLVTGEAQRAGRELLADGPAPRRDPSMGRAAAIAAARAARETGAHTSRIGLAPRGAHQRRSGGPAQPTRGSRPRERARGPAPQVFESSPDTSDKPWIADRANFSFTSPVSSTTVSSRSSAIRP